MTPGFHCGSLEFHDPATLITRLAALGFGAVAIRPRRGAWDLDTDWFDSASATIAGAAREHGVSIVVDLDSPFYDDPGSPDGFSLASDDPAERHRASQKVERWIEKTAAIAPLAITFSTGRSGSRESPARVSLEGRDPLGGEAVLETLAGSIEPLTKLARDAGVQLALRPVSEHAIATVAHFERFGQWLDSSTALGLAADVGEMLLAGEFPIGARLARMQHRLTCVYLCEPDVERGCDQRFGHGDIDLGRVWEVMTASGFSGPGLFRSCGHGRLGLDSAREALALLDDPADRG